MAKWRLHSSIGSIDWLDSLEQFLKPQVRAKAVVGRIDFEIKQGRIILGGGFSQPGQDPLFIVQGKVDEREISRRDLDSTRHSLQLAQESQSLVLPAR